MAAQNSNTEGSHCPPATFVFDEWVEYHYLGPRDPDLPEPSADGVNYPPITDYVPDPNDPTHRRCTPDELLAAYLSIPVYPPPGKKSVS